MLLGIGAAVVILFCGIHLGGLLFGGGPKGFAPTGIHEEVGRALAQVTAERLGGSGTVVILAVDDSHSPFAFAEDQAKATKKALEDNGIEVRETVWLMANQILPEMGVMTVDVYLKAMEPFLDVDGIVSLAGIPVPDPAQGRQEVTALKALPPIYCVTQDRETLKPMMRAGLVNAAVCEKGTAVDMTDGNKPKKPHEWFVAVYEVVTSVPEADSE